MVLRSRSLRLRGARLSRVMSHYKGAASEGDRAGRLLKQREAERHAMSEAKAALEQETRRTANISNKFTKQSVSVVESRMKEGNVGLVHLKDIQTMRQRAEDAIKAEKLSELNREAMKSKRKI